MKTCMVTQIALCVSVFTFCIDQQRSNAQVTSPTAENLDSNAENSTLSQLEELAFHSAAQHVADSVVQIRTVGGLDRVGRTSIARGPTTGLVISADGYIISSAFNFAQQPSSILVRLPSGAQVPAELIARDKNRMLVLLKVESDRPLQVPELAPLDEVQVGQWSIALGRTFRADEVGVSVGIVSATGRMYGRVLQTDANVSVANYGGPLVDIQGRVLGVLIPMSPQTSGEESEIAGAEFYDSGIGFAVPLQHVLDVLPRLQQGKDLLSGKLGIGLVKGSVYVAPPLITNVWQNSPAATADLEKNDLIIAVNGLSIETQAQLRFQLLPRYAGDQVTITVRRGEEEISRDIVLAGELDAYRAAFLGLLPDRTPVEKDQPGVIARAIWPDSPADQAGMQPGDRLLKLGETEIDSVSDAASTVAGMVVDEKVSMLVEREGTRRSLTAKLTTVPNELFTKQIVAEGNKTNIAEGKLELKPLRLAEFVQVANYYASELPNARPHGLLLMLASGDAKNDHILAERWQEYCDRDGLLLVITHPADETGWMGEDLAFLKVLLRMVGTRFTIDPLRSTILGRGKAGQLAFALAFARGSSLTGVISLDAPLPRTLKLPLNLPGRRLSMLMVETPNSPFVPLIRKDVEELLDAGYPASWWQRPISIEDPAEFDPETVSTIADWVDLLDRI